MKKKMNPKANSSDAKLKERQIRSVVYLWRATDKVLISDVDGTITKSDVGGQILPHIGFDYVQKGIDKILNRANSIGYRIIYLTARGYAQCQQTREYLFDTAKLPNGAVICSPSSTRAALYRELVQKRPQDFKIKALCDIRDAFGAKEVKPFVVGLGNKDSDAIAYKFVGIEKDKTFIIGEETGGVEEEEEDIAVYIKNYEKIYQNIDVWLPKLEVK